jgi:hypothetical protein
MASGTDPSAQTPGRAAKLKRLSNALGSISLGAELSLVAINALLLRTTAR